MKKPLVWLTVFLCLGIFLSYKLTLPFWWVYFITLLTLALSVLSVKKGLRFDILLLFSVFLFGTVLLKNTQILPKCHLHRCIPYKSNNIYAIKGFISSEPLYKLSQSSFIFQTQEIIFENLKQNCTGPVLVYIKDKRNFKLGQDLILNGKLSRPYNYFNSGRSNFRDYLHNQGIFFIMRASAVRIVETPNRRYHFRRFASYLKSKMKEKIIQYTSPVPASILGAMVLGERKDIPPLINKNMVRSGTVHILVVSGFNTSIVAFIIFLFLKLIRIPRRARFYIAAILLIVYCFITGASSPVVRSTVMAIIFMFAHLVKREPDIYNSLSISAMSILGLGARQLFDIGFQLSFISVLSIVYLYPKIKLFLRIGAIRIKLIRFIIDGCLVSLSAWLGAMGLIGYYFKIFSPITVLANIFIVPTAALITLCGFCLIIMGFACPPLAPLFASTSELAVAFLLNINNFLIKIPCAYFQLS